MDTKHNYTIGELADRAGVTTRTIRYYTAEGLLPPPDTRGKYANYSEDHLLRLLIITRLKDAYLPLSEIRHRLEGLKTSELQTFLAAHDLKATEPQSNASAYIARVLQSYPGATRAIAEQSTSYQQFPMVPSVHMPMPNQSTTPAIGYIELMPSQYNPTEDGHWQRIRLSSDIELHIREPQSEQRSQQIQQLIEQARMLLNEKEEYS